MFLVGPIAEGIEDVTVVVRWRLDERAKGVVDVMTDGASIATIPSEAALVHVVQLQDLMATTTYEVVVTVTDGSGNAGQSDPVPFVTLATPDTEPPQFVRRPQTDVTHVSATITWQVDEPVVGAARFGPASGDRATSVQAEMVSRVVIIEIPDLESDTDYTYEAVATDLSDNVLTSPVLTFTTLSAPDVASPIVIEGPAVSGISQTQATVSWKTDEPAFSRVVYDHSTSPSPRSVAPWVENHRPFTFDDSPV